MATASSYVVRVLPEAHELECTLTLERPASGPLLLSTPTWVPGAYASMKYGRDLFDIQIIDAEGGHALSWKREGWQGITLAEAPKRVRVSWRAYAYDVAWGELSGIVDHEHAVLRATRYLFAPEVASSAVRVRYELPEGWPIHHPSGAKALEAATWEYPSFAALLDAPVVCGKFERITRTLHGVPFHHVFLDRAVGFETEVEGLIDALMRVAEEAHAIFGSFPFSDYTYVFSHHPGAHWGLEHADSTMIGLGENVYFDAQTRNDAIRVCAHELFHAWNVCRLKPAEFAKLDLVQSPTPDTLWIAEGFTRYYEFVLGVRVGELTPEQFFSNVVNYHRQLTSHPAAARVSPVDSSRATFLNHNKFPGSVNTTIDYYDAGMLVAFDLDVKLRCASARDLDSVFASFFQARGRDARGYSQAEALELLAPDAATRELLQGESEQAGRYSTLERLEELGFEVRRGEAPYLGVVLRENSGPEVANVLDDAPAAKSGLAPGDVIQRVDGFPFSLAAFGWLIKHRSTLKLTVLRGHRTLELEARIARRADTEALIWRGSDAQLARIRSWLKVPALNWKSGHNVALTAFDNFHGIQRVM